MRQLTLLIVLALCFCVSCSSGSGDSYEPPPYNQGDSDPDGVTGDGDLDRDLPDAEPEADPDPDLEPEAPVVDGDADPDLEPEAEAEIQEETPDIFGNVYRSTSYPYEPGPLTTVKQTVAQYENGAPQELLIFSPETKGEYAVIVFQHGFLMANSWYSLVLDWIAGHGFIVVAPQMYEPGGLPTNKPGTWTEASLAVTCLDWIKDNIGSVTGHTARTDLLGLAGHSRGGKVAWIMLTTDARAAKVVAGVDPVDGTGGTGGDESRVINGAFGFTLPTLVIGTGLGPEPVSLTQQACAPAGDNHVQFYEASHTPTYHAVVTSYGHNDVLDDSTDGCGLACTMCPAGGSRAPMRAQTAGLLIAFFRRYLQGNFDDVIYLRDPDEALIAVEMEHK